MLFGSLYSYPTLHIEIEFLFGLTHLYAEMVGNSTQNNIMSAILIVIDVLPFIFVLVI